jgi:glycosyltransferase involved in cell wall biosynthesis
LSNKKKKILFIAPFPPPITGMAIVSKRIIDGLIDKYDFCTINFSKNNFIQGVNSFHRIIEVLKIFIRIIIKSIIADFIYLTLSQSVAGNLKDLFILFLTFGKKKIVHLHGSGIKQTVFDRWPAIRYINKKLYKNVDRVIVLSDSLKKNFAGIAKESRIISVPNFAESYFFLKEDEIREKHSFAIMNILFLSNLLPGKGYIELIETAIRIESELPGKFGFHFAGDFETDRDRSHFLSKIKNQKQIYFHNSVKGIERINLFKLCSIFCLPTYYPFEGQPLSILEAYATGCYVITTSQGGIRDIFKDGENGSLVEKKSVQSLFDAFKHLLFKPRSEILHIGLNNNKYAKKYFSPDIFMKNIDNIFSEFGKS